MAAYMFPIGLIMSSKNMRAIRGAQHMLSNLPDFLLSFDKPLNNIPTMLIPGRQLLSTIGTEPAT